MPTKSGTDPPAFTRALHRLNGTPILVLDGGMGTYLEDGYGVLFDESKPAWSSSVDKEVLAKVHAEYIDAGADIILTATYQATAENMTAVNSMSNGRLNMATVVEQALHAVADSSTHRGPARRKTSRSSAVETESSRTASSMPAVALSLSAYGGTMKPSTEYTGKYPPDMRGSEALCRWHSERLDAYLPLSALQKPNGEHNREIENWTQLEYVAFETLVSVAEATAVGMAMGRLDNSLESQGHGNLIKKFWVCVNYPDHPDGRLLTPCGESPEEVVHGMLIAPSNAKMWTRPWGIGINCTKLQKIRELISRYEDALKVDLVGISHESPPQPWLILYPDGAHNLRYNSERKRWDTVGPAEVDWKGKSSSWASHMMSILRETTQRANWPGIVVGGCCKTTPADIKELVHQLEEARDSEA